MVVGGCGDRCERGGFVGVVAELQQLGRLGAVGDRDHRPLGRVVETGQGVVGHPVHRSRAARTGGLQELDLGLQHGDVSGEIDCGVGHVGARFGEGTGGGSLGAGHLGVEVVGVGAGLGEGVDVSMLGALTHVVNVAFGDDAVGAACGLDQGGAGCVEGLPGAGDGAVDVGGVLGQLVAVGEIGGGQVGITGVVGGADLGGELIQ